MGSDVTAESTDDAADAATDPAECSVPAAVDCGYATGSRRPSAATPTTNHWESDQDDLLFWYLPFTGMESNRGYADLPSGGGQRSAF